MTPARRPTLNNFLQNPRILAPPYRVVVVLDDSRERLGKQLKTNIACNACTQDGGSPGPSIGGGAERTYEQPQTAVVVRRPTMTRSGHHTEPNKVAERNSYSNDTLLAAYTSTKCNPPAGTPTVHHTASTISSLLSTVRRAKNNAPGVRG